MTGNAGDRDADVRRTVERVVDRGFEDIYEKLDQLHSKNIHDNDVIKALRALDFDDVAEGYIDWTGALDPDAEDDNTTLNPVVPDPGDAPSYTALDEQFKNVAAIRQAHAEHFPQGKLANDGGAE